MEDQRFNKQELSMDDELPQCKIKRNYSCNHCKYFTQNPRFHLTHLRDIHGERIIINKCNLCLYASRHYQKLVRHMKMVHGSTDGIAGQSRKRASPESTLCSQQQSKPPTPPLPPLLFPIEAPAPSENLTKDLELSRNALRDIAALYFAENHIGEILARMEEADAALLLPTAGVEREPAVNSFLDETEKSFTQKGDLKCPCGHVSDCLSETIVHRRTCDSAKDRRFCETPSLSEARCQHCHRCCKSSAELANHLKTCLSYEIFQRSNSLPGRESGSWTGGIGVDGDTLSPGTKERPTSPLHDETDSVVHPLASQQKQESRSSSFKKVFKCPRCPFWASTASRFHVHVVGHLNKKPFKCSLCTYRSNWRWDITKHIRLKSIRNASHKIARVLMNDDTGRRNYTKYNKYLTLMKMNDEDGDSRLIKSGEMTPHQVASLGYLRESSPADLANDVAVTVCGEESTEMKQRPPTERVASPIVKFSDDLVVDFKSNSLKKERFFKCRKCSYRHANRDAVLAHIRIHYHCIQREGLPPSTSKGDLRSALQTGGHPVKEGFADGISLTKDPTTIIAACGKESGSSGNDDAPQKTASRDENLGGSTPSALSSKPAFSSTPPASSSSFISDGSKSAKLMDVMTASNFCSNPAEKKVLSPFRCGHCHQVSNWKHVIQRHCRLKHSGNIQIEAFDRSSDDRTPVYRNIDFCGNEQKHHSKGTTAENAMKTHQLTPSSSDNFNLPTKGQDSSVSPCNSQDGHTSLSSSKQLNVMQEAAQFKCTLCPYVCAKRQLLTNHLKVHESAIDPKPSDSDEVREEPTNSPKFPQRFMNAPKKQKQCQKSAGPGRDAKSEGDFSTNQATTLMSSEFVNTSQESAKDDATLQLSFTLSKTDVPDSITKSTNSQPIDATKASKTKTDLTQNSPKSSQSIVDSENPLSCPYRPFKTDCSKSFQSHLPQHLREYSDFITPSKGDLDEHTRLHSKCIATSSNTTHKLKLTGTEKKKRDDYQATKTIHLERKTGGKGETQEKIANVRKRRCSTADSTPAPVSTDRKTILFNPKTGQVIRRK